MEKQAKYPAGLWSVIFTSLALFWEEVRIFFYKHKTIENMLFLLVYTIEQLLLLWFVLVNPKHVFEIIAVFIIIFLSTIGFERICMNSRLGNYKTLFSSAKLAYTNEKLINDLLRNKLEEQQKEITMLKKKGLNIRKTNKNLKR